MKNIILIILIIFGTIANSKDIPKGKLGYLTDGLSMIKHKDSKIAFRLWLNELIVDEKIKASIEYFKESEEFFHSYTQHHFDYLTSNPYYYLKNKVLVDKFSQEFWSVSMNGNEYEEYLILVRKDSNINTLKDLKNKKMAIHQDNYMGKVFLDKEFYEETKKSYKDYIKNIYKTKQHSTAILNTFFRKVDLCVVPKYALDLVSELNPVVKKRLKIIKKSDPIFISIVAMFHKNTKSIVLRQFNEHYSSLKNTSRGQNIMDLFKMKDFRKVKKSYFNPVNSYYQEYLQLIEKYKR